MKWVGVLAVVLALLGVSEAGAASFTPSLNFSYRLAVKWWEREPGACASIEKKIVPAGALGTGEGAEATVPPPEAAPHSVPCHLYFTRQFAPLERIEATCVLMVHEVGHLLGYGHTENLQSPMYLYGPLIDPALCKKAGQLESRGERFRLWLFAEPH